MASSTSPNFHAQFAQLLIDFVRIPAVNSGVVRAFVEGAQEMLVTTQYPRRGDDGQPVGQKLHFHQVIPRHRLFQHQLLHQIQQIQIGLGFQFHKLDALLFLQLHFGLLVE
ncbi:MAG: hypothetical protein DSZ32_00105 [Gammaproteobacteria bacterium]|nr:MAG: hypothetical protein DSZ32_00105 [Gammaproteobacteria bacterium]